MPKLLYIEDGLDNLRDELIYTEGRLLYDENAKDQAPLITAFIKAVDQVRQGQLDCWRAETHAQSHLDSVNYRHDRRTDRLERKMGATIPDHPQGQERYERYFPIAPSKIIALALKSQLKYTRSYAQSLKAEPEPELQEMAAGFAQDIAEADQAISEQEEASTARKNHRVREIVKLYQTINDARRDIHAALNSRITNARLPRDWADSFFRVEKKNTSPRRDSNEKKRVALLALLEARDLEMSEEDRKRLDEETDPATLDRWLVRAASHPASQSLFALAG